MVTFDTKYAGEAGLVGWQRLGFDAKGFGSITDLPVAMANDDPLAAAELEAA